MGSSTTTFGMPVLNLKLTAILAELRQRLVNLYGNRLVTTVLYGSQARGDAEPGSDIDVMVVLKAPVQPCLEVDRSGGILTEVSLAFDELVSCVFVSAKNEGFENAVREAAISSCFPSRKRTSASFDNGS